MYNYSLCTTHMPGESYHRCFRSFFLSFFFFCLSNYKLPCLLPLHRRSGLHSISNGAYWTFWCHPLFIVYGPVVHGICGAWLKFGMNMHVCLLGPCVQACMCARMHVCMCMWRERSHMIHALTSDVSLFLRFHLYLPENKFTLHTYVYDTNTPRRTLTWQMINNYNVL